VVWSRGPLRPHDRGDRPGRAAGASAIATAAARRSAIEDIRDYLASLEPDRLIDLIVNACRRDDRMREKLLLAARGRGDIHAAIKTWKEALKRATAVRGYVDYGEMPYFVAGIRDAVNALDSWITDGRAAAVVELAEYAVSRVESAMEECDDSNGELGGLLAHIVELHLDACRAASPDPAELAERLFEYELNGHWETFSSAAELYAEVLGEPGLARYRRLAEAEWAKVPTLGPGDDKSQTWHGNRYRITQIMETLARRSGDAEALVAVKARDLSSAWRFLQIAEVYREAGRADKALEWAERGLAAFPQRTDGRLREFLIGEYLQRGRGAEAMTLTWAQFAERSDLGGYTGLKATVRQADGDWPNWRDRALKHLRQDIAREFTERNKTGYARMAAPDRSRLVEMLLSEQDIEAAWREAETGGCRDELRLRLADLRAEDHPEDSLAIYRRQAASLVEQTNTPAYEQAMVLIRKIEPLLRNREGGAQQWSDYLAELRGKYADWPTASGCGCGATCGCGPCKQRHGHAGKDEHPRAVSDEDAAQYVLEAVPFEVRGYVPETDKRAPSGFLLHLYLRDGNEEQRVVTFEVENRNTVRITWMVDPATATRRSELVRAIDLLVQQAYDGEENDDDPG
jgi:tetratricopeptide (TPR) repeat protein